MSYLTEFRFSVFLARFVRRKWQPQKPAVAPDPLADEWHERYGKPGDRR